MSAWETSTELCVSCPDCGFTFDSAHTDVNGGYSCPECAETKLRAALADYDATVKQAQDELLDQGDRDFYRMQRVADAREAFKALRRRHRKLIATEQVK